MDVGVALAWVNVCRLDWSAGDLSFFSCVAEEECPQHLGGWIVFRPEMIDGQKKASLYREVGGMPDVDGGFQGCCCGNRRDWSCCLLCIGFFGGWVAYLRILSMSGSVCLPQAPPFHLHNLLQEKINEDLVLDCHLPFL